MHDWAKGDPGPIKESNSSGPKWVHIIFNENNKYKIFMNCKVSILRVLTLFYYWIAVVQERKNNVYNRIKPHWLLIY